jgi:hypothetical protein
MISEILTDDSLKYCCFPAREFSELHSTFGITLDWNSDEAFGKIRQIIQYHCLPLMSQSILDSCVSVKDMHLTFLRTNFIPGIQYDLCKDTIEAMIEGNCGRIMYLENLIHFYTLKSFGQLKEIISQRSIPYLPTCLTKKVQEYLDLSKQKLDQISYCMVQEFSPPKSIPTRKRKTKQDSPKMEETRSKMSRLILSAKETIQNIKDLEQAF